MKRTRRWTFLLVAIWFASPADASIEGIEAQPEIRTTIGALKDRAVFVRYPSGATPAIGDTVEVRLESPEDRDGLTIGHYRVIGFSGAWAEAAPLTVDGTPALGMLALVNPVARAGSQPGPAQPAATPPATASSANASRIAVPDVRGQTSSAAIAQLAGLGLQPSLAAGDVPTRQEQAFTVVETDPPAGATVSSGTSVSVKIFGPFSALTVVPEAIGQPKDAAERTIRAAGLDVEWVEVQGGSIAGQVISLEPAAGSRVLPGYRVRASVAIGPPRVTTPVAAVAPPSAPGGDIAMFSTYGFGPNVRDRNGTLSYAPTFRVIETGRVFFVWSELPRTSYFQPAHGEVTIMRLVTGADGRPEWSFMAQYGGRFALAGELRPPPPDYLDLPPGEYLLLPTKVGPTPFGTESYRAQIRGPVIILSRPTR